MSGVYAYAFNFSLLILAAVLAVVVHRIGSDPDSSWKAEWPWVVTPVGILIGLILSLDHALK